MFFLQMPLITEGQYYWGMMMYIALGVAGFIWLLKGNRWNLKKTWDLY
jgi:hypothetical protein